MHAAKRKRLEAAGWRIGSAKKFLGLTKEQAALLEMKLALAGKVKALRVKHQIRRRRMRRG